MFLLFIFDKSKRLKSADETRNIDSDSKKFVTNNT